MNHDREGPRRADAAAYPPELLASHKRLSVALVVPAVNEADTIAATMEPAIHLVRSGVLDEVVVVDGGSEDATVEVAAATGARTVRAPELHPDLGPVLGKGDALWRALSLLDDADVIVFLDADLQGDVATFICGLAGPLLLDEGVDFVKGSFHRIRPDGADPDDPFDGGRVTELMARPLLNLWRPDLAAFYQPLGGQVAGRATVLRSIPFLTGYAVEVAMLVDVVDLVGLARLVEVELGPLRNRPRATTALAPMAQEVLYGFANRVLPPEARPPWEPYTRPRTATAAGSPPAVVERPPRKAYEPRR